MNNMTELPQSINSNEIPSKMSNLTATIVHEIRNPLTTINGILQLIKLNLNDKKLNQYVTVALQELERTNGILGQLLHLDKPMNVEKQVVSLNEIIYDFSLFYENEANNLHISMTTDLTKENPFIYGNKEQIKQVIMNLIKNAFEAIEGDKNHGEIFIQTYIEKPYAVLSIKDNGCGISNSHLTKMFTPFFTTKNTGSGIGLSLCKEIIEEHQGYIKVESIEGEYTNFLISIPLFG